QRLGACDRVDRRLEPEPAEECTPEVSVGDEPGERAVVAGEQREPELAAVDGEHRVAHRRARQHRDRLDPGADALAHSVSLNPSTWSRNSATVAKRASTVTVCAA